MPDKADIVRAGFDRFPSPELFDVLSPDIEWHVRSDLPDAGVYHGHEGMRQLLGRFEEILDEMWIRPEEFIDAGEETVIVPLRWGGTGKGSGVEVEERGETWVFNVRDEKIVRVNEYGTRAEALEAAS